MRDECVHGGKERFEEQHPPANTDVGSHLDME